MCSAIFKISTSVDPKRVQTEGAQGQLLWLSQFTVLGSTFGTLFSPWRLHCGVGASAERDPTLVVGGTPAKVFSFQFVEKKLTPEGLIGNSVGTAGPLGEFLCMLP